MDVGVCQLDNAVKNYMDYRTVTDTTSTQYSIISQSTIGDDGILYYDNHILVALGSYYGPIGSKYKMTFENGNQAYVIKADQKSDVHVTDSCYHERNNSMIEVIVDTNKLPTDALISGDINNIGIFNGKIIKIEKEKPNV